MKRRNTIATIACILAFTYALCAATSIYAGNLTIGANEGKLNSEQEDDEYERFIKRLDIKRKGKLSPSSRGLYETYYIIRLNNEKISNVEALEECDVLLQNLLQEKETFEWLKRRPDVPLGEFRTRCKLNLTLEEADDLPNNNLRPETMVMVLGGAESALIRGGSKEALDILDTLFRQPWGAATLQRDDNARELASTLWMRTKVEQRQKEIKSHGDSSGKAAVQQAEAQRQAEMICLLLEAEQELLGGKSGGFRPIFNNSDQAATQRQAKEAEQARLQAEIQRIFEENERMMRQTQMDILRANDRQMREAIEADNRYWQMMNENNRRYWEQETKRISESIKGIDW